MFMACGFEDVQVEYPKGFAERVFVKTWIIIFQLVEVCRNVHISHQKGEEQIDSDSGSGCLRPEGRKW